MKRKLDQKMAFEQPEIEGLRSPEGMFGDDNQDFIPDDN